MANGDPDITPAERAAFYALWAGMLADDLEPRPRIHIARSLPPIDWDAE